MATWEPRFGSLDVVLGSLTNQADEIHVFVNSFNTVPDCLPMQFSNVTYYCDGNNYGDRAKLSFQNLHNEPVNYFSCDDDIIYPVDYVTKSLELLKNDPTSIYSYHGSILHENYTTLGLSRTLYDYRKKTDLTTLVHYGGTGVSFWDTEYVNIPRDLSNANDALDAIVALWANHRNIKIYTPQKEALWLKDCDTSNRNCSITNRPPIIADHLIVKHKLNQVKLNGTI